jgi:hypothetical protein
LQRHKLALPLALAAGLAFMPLDSTAQTSPLPAHESARGQLAARLPLLAPRAVAWAETLAANARPSGVPLSPALTAIARKVGVRAPEKVRIIVLDDIPLPDDPVLKGAALSVGLSQGDAAGMTLGHTIFLRRGYENDLRVASHELRHVAQYEASGGIAGFLAVHLADLVAFGYEDSPFEVDARAHEVRARPAAS